MAKELKELGVKPHQNVLILAPFGVDFLVTFWALLQGDAIPQPVSMNLEPTEMDAIFAQVPDLLNCALVVQNNEFSHQVALRDGWVTDIALKINLEASKVLPLSDSRRRSATEESGVVVGSSEVSTRHLSGVEHLGVSSSVPVEASVP